MISARTIKKINIIGQFVRQFSPFGFLSLSLSCYLKYGRHNRIYTYESEYL